MSSDTALTEAEGRQEVQDLVQAGEDRKRSAEGILVEEELEVRRTPVLTRLPVGVRYGDLVEVLTPPDNLSTRKMSNKHVKNIEMEV